MGLGAGSQAILFLALSVIPLVLVYHVVPQLTTLPTPPPSDEYVPAPPAIDPPQAVYAVAEIGGGCALDAVPVVKEFVNKEVQNYYNLELKLKEGGNPWILFYDQNNVQVDAVKITRLDMNLINHVLTSRGIKRKPVDRTDNIK
eukprot:TRINITY_DN1147_c0_g1_i1.p1 TRINITY_DN1147_c0_g1~~TRINITY_DN1147_c0_g1_i1.p1  ORF type:complete len:144 (-),score=33.42 TRINITY_DN1147_c0_g1_i1:79-510(-)